MDIEMPVRLSVSNLAWGAEQHGEVLDLLAALGVHGIEVAPTKIAPWADLAPEVLRKYRSEIESAGLRVSSLQAIFYGVHGAILLGDSNAFRVMSEHIRAVAEVGWILGAQVLVYGAPSTRLRRALSLESARALAAQRFGVLGDIVGSFGLTIGIEPVPQAYGGDFLTSAFDVIELVREVRHPSVRLHLDTGCALLAGDEIDDAIREGFAWLGHFHAAEPELGNFSMPRASHGQAAEALRQCGYARWLAIEMRAQTTDTIGALRGAINYVAATYGIATPIVA
jgi:sugar phosphate isomerase/epimerase